MAEFTLDLMSKAIYEPFRDELFTAELKRGAFLNGPLADFLLSFFCMFSREQGVFLGDNSSIKGRHATTEIDLHIFAAP